MSLTSHQGCKSFQISFWASWDWKLFFSNKPPSTSFSRAKDAMQIPISKRLEASNVFLFMKLLKKLFDYLNLLLKFSLLN